MQLSKNAFFFYAPRAGNELQMTIILEALSSLNTFKGLLQTALRETLLLFYIICDLGLECVCLSSFTIYLMLLLYIECVPSCELVFSCYCFFYFIIML